MPCYLITLHAYGSWLPDRPRGYVKRKQGILPRDDHMRHLYRLNANDTQVVFDRPIQQILIDAGFEACQHQDHRPHMIATDPTHFHLLVSWHDDRDSVVVRKGLKCSLTRKLNAAMRRRPWLADGGSRKRVRDQSHFDYLVSEYLPHHRGLKWREGEGVFE